MSSLPNYLLTHRKRASLTQEETAFLLGGKGMDKGIKVCRDEKGKRLPSLETALAYSVIYDVPVNELFVGLYEEIQQNVAKRAKILKWRVEKKPDPIRQGVLARLMSKLPANRIPA